MSIRCMKVHFDATPESIDRLQLARHLAEVQGAGVTAVYAAPHSSSQVPADAVPLSSLAVFRELDEQRQRKAFVNFEAAMKEPGPHATWAAIDVDPVFTNFVQDALCADLLVLGQRSSADCRDDEMPHDFAESVVIASGRPAIVVPCGSRTLDVGRRIVLAWKATPEAMHAVTAALPLMQQADQVHLATWGEPDAGPQELAGIEHYLRQHDIEPKRYEGGSSNAVGDAVLAFCRQVSADLLVMGCYGHTRFRERVLGGATRTVLHSMTLPVLLAH